ncbi:unnamed protein product [Auanema sp. JU1783]|nr:unnamed protein product [Auanema sp. JU1783]
MKILVFVVVSFLAVNAMPADLGQADNCGAKKAVRQFKLLTTGEAASDFECEMCLDLVLISETYAECGEAEEEHKMENKCDEKYSKNPIEDRACRSMVDKIAHRAE